MLAVLLVHPSFIGLIVFNVLGICFWLSILDWINGGIVRKFFKWLVGLFRGNSGRKPPSEHEVRGHYRDGVWVEGYKRGSDGSED